MSDKIPVVDASPPPPKPKKGKAVKYAPNSSSGVRHKVHPKIITGFFQNIRFIAMYTVMAIWFLLPWLRYDGRQAIWLDLKTHHFYIFKWMFMPSDMFFLSWVFIMAAFTLFIVTVFTGRVFCGYACPQTVWTNLFMRIEKFFEGDRNHRIKLDESPMSLNKILRKSGKFLGWFTAAFATGLTFVSYFASTDRLYGTWEIVKLGALSLPFPVWSGWATFFVFFISFATFLNAGYMRELFCFHICPYGRFQSVMIDKDSLIISYDAERGDPRGARKRNQEKSDQVGDCIDCLLCVHVCPTGIDIRDGLQMECIQCAACVDACDSVMDRMGYPRGLVRYTTERQLLEKEKTHWLRPRLLGYMSVLIIMLSVFSYVLMHRVPVLLESLHDRSSLYTINTSGQIENAVMLKLVNKTDHPHTYQIGLKGPEAIKIDGQAPEISLDPGELYQLPVTVIADLNAVKDEDTPIRFTAKALDNESIYVESLNHFKAPSKKEREQYESEQ